jgi:hypothetical protein
MAGTITTSTIQNDTSSPPTFRNNSVEIGTLCRAWVNFNGTGTVAIRGSFNVSSITDNGTGSYTVNFTTAMPDANYSWSSITGSPGSTNGVTLAGTPTASAIPLVTVNTGFSVFDQVYVTCSVFR